MTPSIAGREIREEARLLFALLDAIQDERLISGTPFESRWLAIKGRVNAGSPYEDESEESFELLAEIEGAAVIRETWMEKRWRAVEARIQRGR